MQSDMSSTAYAFERNRKISQLVIFMGFLFIPFLAALGYINDKSFFSVTLSFFVAGTSSFFAYMMLKTKWSSSDGGGDLLYSLTNLICNLVAILFVYLIDPLKLENYLFLLAIIMGSLDALWILKRRYAIFMAICLVALGAFVIYLFPTGYHFKLVALLCSCLLCLWKIKNALLQGALHQYVASVERLGAYQATMTSLEHEFNNLSAIALGAINIIRKKNQQEVKYFASLERALHRLLELIKTLGKVSTFEVEEYTEGNSMVKLESEKNESSGHD